MMKTGTTCKTTKRYPRVTAGPLRHAYVHRIVAAALIGRDLTKDEEVHHKDGDRRNFHFTNLHVMGEKDHGWVSSKQHQFMKRRDDAECIRFEEFMKEEGQRMLNEAIRAKAAQQPWFGDIDGTMAERWQVRESAFNQTAAAV